MAAPWHTHTHPCPYVRAAWEVWDFPRPLGILGSHENGGTRQMEDLAPLQIGDETRDLRDIENCNLCVQVPLGK